MYTLADFSFCSLFHTRTICKEFICEKKRFIFLYLRCLFQRFLMTHLRDVFLLLSSIAALPSTQALLGSRAVLECDLNSMSAVSRPSVDSAHARGNTSGNINNLNSLIQVIIWYKGNTTGSPIYSIDARSSGGSLESADKFPAKAYGDRLTLNPIVRPIALVIDPVELEDEGDYFCRMVSTLASFAPSSTHETSAPLLVHCQSI